jgi:hypothetical protein
MTRRLALAALFGCLLGSFAARVGRAADEPLPKPEAILDHYVEVTGGKALYQKHKSEIVLGTVEFPAQGLKGSITRYAADPDRSYSQMNIDAVGTIELGTSGGVAWEKSALLGARIKTGEEKTQALREAQFNAPLEWRKLYSKVETAGLENLGGEDCYKVVLTPASGKPETMYFGKKSGLLVKTTLTAVSQMGEVPVESAVSDYKTFDGILVPTKVRQKAAGQEFTITIQSVKANAEIPADRFELPADVKALLDKAPAAGKP